MCKKNRGKASPATSASPVNAARALGASDAASPTQSASARAPRQSAATAPSMPASASAIADSPRTARYSAQPDQPRQTMAAAAAMPSSAAATPTAPSAKKASDPSKARGRKRKGGDEETEADDDEQVAKKNKDLEGKPRPSTQGDAVADENQAASSAPVKPGKAVKKPQRGESEDAMEDVPAPASAAAAAPGRTKYDRPLPPTELTALPSRDAYVSFDGPHYQPARQQHAGGECSRIVIGPAGLWSKGTDAEPDRPKKGMAAAIKQYGSKKFKAGHMLNSEFQGAGDIDENYTILTNSANRTHTGFDNPIKDAVLTLMKVYEILRKKMVDIRQLKMGIFIEVKTSSKKWGTTFPDNLICDSLECDTKLVNDKVLCAAPMLVGEPEDVRESVKKEIGQINAFLAKARQHGTVDNSKNTLAG